MTFEKTDENYIYYDTTEQTQKGNSNKDCSRGSEFGRKGKRSICEWS